MFAIRMFPNLSNHVGKKVNSRPLFASVNYATKRLSLEEKLGIPERPKKPLSPYIDYVQHKFAEYSSVNPKLPLKEVIPKCAEQWNLIDKETKTKLMNEYRKKLKNYSEVLQQYYSSLTDAQHVQLEAAKKDKNESTQKKQLRLQNKITGKPIRPNNPFGIFVKEVYSKIITADSEKSNKEPINLKEISKQWYNLTPEEKANYKLKFDVVDQVYRKKLAEWEEEMVRQGKTNLIRIRSRPTLVVDESLKLSKETLPIKTTTKRK